ncbi:hypothetical protein ACN38_g9849 [Penicillium nordicum]|uniref:Secreted protein n=1 Tax=Penicillium nordicum TaxID=229535 RepID=A0A0M8NTX0_9EURO|nr:hypothetical protein ACN38_g9849 [Penicillium nordicum]
MDASLFFSLSLSLLYIYPFPIPLGSDSLYIESNPVHLFPCSIIDKIEKHCIIRGIVIVCAISTFQKNRRLES